MLILCILIIVIYKTWNYVIRRQPNKRIFIEDFKCTALKNHYSAVEVNSYLIGRVQRPSKLNCRLFTFSAWAFMAVF